MRFGVSVYIPNRNHAATLGVAIHSCVTESPIEVAVIDDASTDGSVGIIEAAAEAYPCVWLHQHPQKSQCWERAAAELFPDFRGRHVIGLGADDELYHGVVPSVMRHSSAPIVFHHYLVRRPGCDPKEAVSVNVENATTLSACEVQARMTSDMPPCETGVGSAIRHDWLEWLCDLEYWVMGPWADAIGYAAVAAMAGCVYVPQVGAIFTNDDAGYGASNRDGEKAAKYHEACRRFMARTGLPSDVCTAILAKRGINA